MKDIVKLIFDRVFSFTTLIAVSFALIIFVSIRVDQKNDLERDARKMQVAACYDAGMVLVESDAGPRCAKPADLAAIKFK